MLSGGTYTAAPAQCTAMGGGWREPTKAEALSITGAAGYDTCVFQSSWDTWVSDEPGHWIDFQADDVPDPAGSTYIMCVH